MLKLPGFLDTRLSRRHLLTTVASKAFMIPSQARKEITVMAIEPGETALSTRKLLIESVGFNCISAVSGDQALRMLDKHVIDAVLFDIDISDMEPTDFLVQVDAKRPDIPIFAVARNGWVPDQLKSKFTIVFEKMADPRDLVENLVQYFSDRAAA